MTVVPATGYVRQTTIAQISHAVFMRHHVAVVFDDPIPGKTIAVVKPSPPVPAS
jgi:hypothetical protein